MQRLAVSLVLVILTALVGLGWLLNQVYSLSHDEDHSRSVSLYGAFVKDIARTLENHTDNQNFIERWNVSSEFVLSLSPIDNFPLPPELAQRFHGGEILALQSEGQVSLHYWLEGSNEVLSIDMPNDFVDEQTGELDLVLTLSFYFAIVMVVLLWLSPLIRQLIRLRIAAIRFGQGNFDSRIKISRFSYIAEIESEFNQMANKIQSLIKDNKLLSRAVSHDLKTPIARLRFGIETLNETENEDARQRYTQRLLDDLDTMEGLVYQLLEYAQLDQASINLSIKDFDLHSFCEELFRRGQVDGKTIRYQLEAKDHIVAADQHYLAMLLNNISGNALRYANKQVLVRTENLGRNKIRISIEDDGPGISDQNKALVFMPFWRDKSKQGGANHGMGLAIAERIAAWHKTQIKVADSERLGGALFSFELECR